MAAGFNLPAPCLPSRLPTAMDAMPGFSPGGTARGTRRGTSGHEARSDVDARRRVATGCGRRTRWRARQGLCALATAFAAGPGALQGQHLQRRGRAARRRCEVGSGQSCAAFHR
ncbi:hypothetical protein G6F59_016791 [Rhizopus arrhizus]|nr:hypothetical protein G6F59_016791 [Rhizopus arrhizus]